MIHIRRQSLTQTSQRFNKAPGQCWPCSELLQEENLNTQVAFSMAGQGGEGQRPFLLHSGVGSQGPRDITALQSKGPQVTGTPGTPTTHFAGSPCVQATSEDASLVGAVKPTKDRQDFCFPGLVRKNHTPPRAPCIYDLP